MKARSCPAVIVSGAGSNQGKSTITAALAFYHRKQGRHVRAFKAGPDFLDPMLLEVASGNPVYQLDLWMVGENNCRNLLYEAAQTADIILIEGVMGLFDGTPSTADLARKFTIPVITVINASAMAQTFHALAHGLTNFDPQINSWGVLANNVGSTRHAQMLANNFPTQINYLGAVERSKSLAIPSRHLGLMQAPEFEGLERVLQEAADAISHTRAIDMPPSVEFTAGVPDPSPRLLNGTTIGIARDCVFSFLYRANLDLLEQLGARLSFFSPLADCNLPEVDCLYLPGGYPELHLEQLASNQAMKQAIRAHHDQSKPIYAECGGMLYLLETLQDKNGTRQNMVGIIPGCATMQTSLSRLGYQQFSLQDETINGHTFHYSSSTITLSPIAHASHPQDSQQGEPAYRLGNTWASYVHLYFASNPKLAAQLFRPQ